jgi:hypothetical protein
LHAPTISSSCRCNGTRSRVSGFGNATEDHEAPTRPQRRQAGDGRINGTDGENGNVHRGVGGFLDRFHAGDA